MAIKTQRTQLYFVDPSDGTVLAVDCPTGVSGIETTNDQIETTCLDQDTKTFESGLSTPGSASININFDPRLDTHVKLMQLKTAGETLQFAVGFSDGYGVAPTAVLNSEADYELVLPTTRSWLEFEGYINSYSFDFSANDVVKATIGVQVSGEVALYPKV